MEHGIRVVYSNNMDANPSKNPAKDSNRMDTHNKMYCGDMLPIKDEEIHSKALEIAEELKRISSYPTFFEDIRRLVSSPLVHNENFKHSMKIAMKEKGLETRVRNYVYYWLRNKHVKNHNLDPIMALAKAANQWEKRIHKSLTSMSNDLDTALAKSRNIAQQEELSSKWHELSTFSIDLTKYRPVYAPKDFLEVLLSLLGYAPQHKADEPKWELAHLPLKVNNLEKLRQHFKEWSRGDQLLGVAVAANTQSTLELERIALAKKIILGGYAPVIQEFLRKGCPQCYRAQCWAAVLPINIEQHEVAYFKKLKKSFIEVDLMIDKLIFKDVQLTASNDDQYFVFEDILYQVMLCFTRDTEILEMLRETIGTPMSAAIKGMGLTDNKINFPPSGVIPFHGLAMFVTPLCYLYNDPVQLYFTFRAFYCRYWHRLHYINTHPQGIVSLCLLYERLLEAHEPLLWIHFKNVNINPIRVVFKWLMRAFSGHLPPEQLLFLWDAVLGYDSLELLPLLALAILSFRKETIYQVTTLANVDAILADLSTVPVITLLQLALIE